ncbi:hypothetical protein E2P81_ATG07670 [Venturia nashicola]|nr:hypothetical protein E2P81_ATG07670 [Venturia nashicola]
MVCSLSRFLRIPTPQISLTNSIYLDSNLQLPIPPPRCPPPHLYLYLCPLHTSRIHGPKQRWFLWNFLEIRARGGEAEPVCESGLYRDGDQCVLL